MYPARRKHPNSNAAAQGEILPPAAAARVPVLLPYPFAGPFDYRVPAGMNPQPGDLVLVPLNRRQEVGVVWDSPPDGSVGDNRLRPIASRIDALPMRADLRRLIDWIAAYTITPPGEVLAMALRVNALAPPTAKHGWARADLPDGLRLTEARSRVLDAVQAGPLSGPDLARAAGYDLSGVLGA